MALVPGVFVGIYPSGAPFCIDRAHNGKFAIVFCDRRAGAGII